MDSAEFVFYSCARAQIACLCLDCYALFLSLSRTHINCKHNTKTVYLEHQKWQHHIYKLIAALICICICIFLHFRFNRTLNQTKLNMNTIKFKYYTNTKKRILSITTCPHPSGIYSRIIFLFDINAMVVNVHFFVSYQRINVLGPLINLTPSRCTMVCPCNIG